MAVKERNTGTERQCNKCKKTKALDDFPILKDMAVKTCQMCVGVVSIKNDY